MMKHLNASMIEQIFDNIVTYVILILGNVRISHTFTYKVILSIGKRRIYHFLSGYV